VAVSAFKDAYRGEHVVVVYRGSGAVWEAVRVIGGGFRGPGERDGQLCAPTGLRFSGDGTTICVADSGRINHASVFRVGDGGFVRHIAMDYLEDDEEQEVVVAINDVEVEEGGWLVACTGPHRVQFVEDGIGYNGRRPTLGKADGDSGSGDGEFRNPTALALVPGLGLVVREEGNGRLQVFA
jgi:hypothetical protein